MHTGESAKFETQVLIIGNGPAGIALSAFLSGMHPFYDVCHPHENPTVHEKLMAAHNISLLDQDLSWSENLSELSQTGRPLSVLYDMLVRPGADVGTNAPGSLIWEMNAGREIPHLVVGDGRIGGSWNQYDPEMLTVSFSDWLDMPGFSMEEWLGGVPLVKRLPSIAVASYLNAYTERIGSKKNFLCDIKVTSVKKHGESWITEGIRNDGKKIEIKSTAVVIACGKTSPKKLIETASISNPLPLKNCEDNTVYDSRSLKSRIDVKQHRELDYAQPSTSSEPVVVVGDGISSVDCVRECLERNIPVVHVIRRTAKQLRNIMMSRLSPTHYSEYTNIYRLMIGREANENYTRILEGTVGEVRKNSLNVYTPKGKLTLNYSVLAVCIGRESHFDEILPDTTFLDYRSQQDDTLFAVGAYVGDHFVRYLVGGCLRVAQHIVACQKICTNNNNNEKC
ncbi:unnamed protein product [Caenorhabditis bovis]|uniref:FAD/NAD(P)-binding domain-containing protein n=1 Tax=Caenorhabditis bovis TaxID=2654633 RepID=A0A8S1F655_9PELO|nr:unnamed protein product [Caenorhabditis bovis]